MRKVARLSVMAIAIAMSSTVVQAGGETEVLPKIVEESIVSNDFYVGVALAYNRTYSTNSSWFSKTATQDETGGVLGLFGYNFNKYIGVEGRLGESFFS